MLRHDSLDLTDVGGGVAAARIRRENVADLRVEVIARADAAADRL
jgi:hypothetical protein